MAEPLEMWLTRQLREVEEDGRSTKTIKLIAGERPWERWDAPLLEEHGGPGPRKLAELIEELLKAIAEEAPARQGVPCMVLALDGKGEERATWLKTVKGTAKGNGSANSFSSEAMNYAEAGKVHMQTTKELLQMQNATLANAFKQNAQLMESNQALTQMVVNMNVQNALTKQEFQPGLNEEIVKSLAEKVPQLLELFGAMVQPKAGA